MIIPEEYSQLYTDAVSLHIKILEAYSINVAQFMEDAVEATEDEDLSESLIDPDDAPFDARAFNAIRDFVQKSTCNHEALIRETIHFVRATPTEGLFNIGGISFRSGRAYSGTQLNIYVDGEIQKTLQHSVIYIDNYIYDFIMGINGVPMPDYIKFLFTLNKTLGVDAYFSNFVGVDKKTGYITALQYASMCGVIGPTYKQFQEIGNVQLL